jgi:hypothetical protein
MLVSGHLSICRGVATGRRDSSRRLGNNSTARAVCHAFARRYNCKSLWRFAARRHQAARRFGDRRGINVTDVKSAFGQARGIGPELPSTAHPDDAHDGSGRAGGRRRASRAGRRVPWPGGTGTRLLASRVLALAAAVAVAGALTVTGCSSSGSSSAQPKPSATHKTTHKPNENCGSSGCAMVRTSRSLPALTVLYGASCSGIHGDWFFNAVEGGASDALRPSYALLWSFKGGATSAKPSARTISVPHTKTTKVTLTLSNGTMKLSGVRAPNTTVSATGSLIVRLSGSATSPSLTFIERGLRPAEHRLGLVSPFNAGGHPLVVPIQHVRTLPAC